MSLWQRLGPQMATSLVAPQFITNEYGYLWGMKNHHYLWRLVAILKVATKSDLWRKNKLL
jgi:hypothetical protein